LRRLMTPIWLLRWFDITRYYPKIAESGNGRGKRSLGTLRRPGLMSVAWWTTEFGRQLQLTSGSAVVVRQQAP
jgi:hypothetical protein